MAPDRPFLQKINIRCRKTRSRKASRKNIVFRWIFDAKMGGVERQKTSWRVVLVTIYDVSVVHEKASKMEGKRGPKTISKSSFGCPGIRFLSFFRVF